MIERKHGKIVTVSSVAAIASLPFGVTYTATKYGIDGFMNALYDELCIHNLEDRIKLTTIYPDFVSTRKELADFIEKVDYKFGMLTTERVADEAVESIKLGKRRVVVSDLKLIHILIK